MASVPLLHFVVDDGDDNIANIIYAISYAALLGSHQDFSIKSLSLVKSGLGHFQLNGEVADELLTHLGALQRELLSRLQSLIVPIATRLGTETRQLIPSPLRAPSQITVMNARARLRKARARSMHGAWVRFDCPSGNEAFSVCLGGDFDTLTADTQTQLIGQVCGYGKTRGARTIKLRVAPGHYCTVVVPDRVNQIPSLSSVVVIEVRPVRSGRATYQLEWSILIQQDLIPTDAPIANRGPRTTNCPPRTRGCSSTSRGKQHLLL